MSENPIADALGAPGSRASFHQGDALQFVPQPPGGGESSEVDQAALEADRRNLHAPTSRPRWGTDDDGNPIEAPLGGIPFDAEAGTLLSPDQWPKEEPEPEPAPTPAPAPAPAPPPTTTSTSSTSSTTATPSS